MAIDLLKYMIWKNGTGGGGASYEKSVGPAPIISISDAKAKPAKSLIVGMEPIQDLHGYDSPWPAGGGKNKLNNTMTIVTRGGVTFTPNNDGTVTTSGTSTNSISDVSFANNIDLLPNTDYILTGSPSGGSSGTYRLNLLINGSQAVIDYGSGASFTTPEQITSLRVYPIVLAGVDMNGKVYKPMIRLASVTDATYAPYSNICPISGRTGLTAYRTGVNVWDEEVSVVGSHINSKNNIPVLPNTEYAWVSTAQPANGFWFKDADGNTISTIYAINTGKFTTPANCRYVAFALASAYGTTYNHDISINYPATDTDYHAYTGASYPVSWQTEAGTVYGGTVDLVSGLLTVDRVIDIITKDSAWYGFSTGTGNSSAVCQLSNYLNSKYVDGASSFNGAISSTGREAPNYWTGGRQNETPNEGDMCFAYSQTGQLRFHRTDVANITDLASFKANFPDTSICYYLATPQTYQLTPTQIQLLKGSNVLWSDADDLTLAYIGTTPPNLLGGMLGGGIGNPQEPVSEEPAEEPSEEPEEEPVSEEPQE